MIGGTLQRVCSNTAFTSGGNVRGTLSSNPPPVMCDIAFTRATC